MAHEAATGGSPPRLTHAAAVSVGAAAVLLAHIGYQFEQYDQLQYLLLPYRHLYPDFALGDWFTWQTAHYHVTFAWIVSGLGAVAGLDGLPTAMFAAHLGALLWLGYAIFRLSHSWGTGAWGACLAVLVFAMIRHKGIGGATIEHGHLLPADLALPPLLLALSAWIEGRRRWAGLQLGLSGLLHANFAVLGPMVVALAELPGLWRARGRLLRALRPIVEMAGIYVLVASPTLWMVAQAFTTEDGSPQAVDIIFQLRSPHHYALSAMSPADIWWPALLFAWAVPAAKRTLVDPGAARRRMIAGGVLVLLLLGLVGTLLSIGPIVRLFTWRVSMAALCLLLFEVARALRDSILQRDRTAMALWAAGLVCASTFARTDLPLIAGLGLPETLFALPAIVLLIGAGLTSAAPPAGSAVRAVVAGLCLLWAGHAWTQPPQRHMHGGTMRSPKVSGPRLSPIVLTGAAHRKRLRALHRYAREQTPPGSRFLIPPHMVDFRMATQRAVFVDFKAAPMRGDEALEWRRRMRAAAGVERFATRGYALRYDAGRRYLARPLRQLAELARAEHMDYIVASNTKRPGRLGLRKLFTDVERSRLRNKPTRWVLYEVLDE